MRDRTLLFAAIVSSVGIAIPYLLASSARDDSIDAARSEYEATVKQFCGDQVADVQILTDCIQAFDAWLLCRARLDDGADELGVICDHPTFRFDQKQRELVNRMLK